MEVSRSYRSLRRGEGLYCVFAVTAEDISTSNVFLLPQGTPLKVELETLLRVTDCLGMEHSCWTGSVNAVVDSGTMELAQHSCDISQQLTYALSSLFLIVSYSIVA